MIRIRTDKVKRPNFLLIAQEPDCLAACPKKKNGTQIFADKNEKIVLGKMMLESKKPGFQIFYRFCGRFELELCRRMAYESPEFSFRHSQFCHHPDQYTKMQKISVNLRSIK